MFVVMVSLAKALVNFWPSSGRLEVSTFGYSERVLSLAKPLAQARLETIPKITSGLGYLQSTSSNRSYSRRSFLRYRLKVLDLRFLPEVIN